MIWNRALVSFVLHLGVMLPVTVGSSVHVVAVAGEPVSLLCPFGTRDPMPKLVWKHKTKVLLQHSQGTVFKGDKLSMYRFQDPDKGNFSLVIPRAEEGIYTCEVDTKPPFQKAIDLQVVYVNASHNGFLLEGATLQLQMHFSGGKPIPVEWFGPHKVRVRGSSRSRWNLTNNDRILQIRHLQVQEDHGTWECHIMPSGPILRHSVKVIGFRNALGEETRFAAVNSSVRFSYPLNIDLQKEALLPYISEMIWRPAEHKMPQPEKHTPIGANCSSLSKEIPRVRFEDAGRYECRLGFGKQYVNKTIHLVVMKVFARPPGQLSEEAKPSLCCQISAPDPKALLRWEHDANGSQENSDLAQKTFCVSANTAGLWRCSLLVDNDVKISINYSTEEAPSIQNKFPLIEVAAGAGLPLLMLILAGTCVLVCKAVQKKRQRAKRLAQAKQHLLARRTCQCQKELTNDYYHA